MAAANYMKALCVSIVAALALGSPAHVQEVLFQDDFKGKLGAGWSWVREHREAWRVTELGLEVRIEPGNMWGPQNDARNLLVPPTPDSTKGEIEVSVNAENMPSNQFEQVDLVWYYNDSNMVKLGQELVDGKLSVVMGREENDKTITVAIIPLSASSVRLSLFAKGNQIRGRFRAPGAREWSEAGQCSLPAPSNAAPKISLQFYQGSEKAEHWARVSEFRILKHR